jgi:hypothetical protein
VTLDCGGFTVDAGTEHEARGAALHTVAESLDLFVVARSDPAAVSVSPAEPSGVELIATERQRQIDAEGWTPDHDDLHDQGELALAAACYAIPDGGDASEPVRFPTRSLLDGVTIPPLWPWAGRWYKRTPYDRKRELVKAGALIAAEIDRLQRKSDA